LTVILGLCATALLKPFTAPVNTGWSNRANAITQHLDAWWALERDHFRGRRLDDDWRTDTRDVITLIYEAAEGTSMFDPNQFERMVEMESRLLDIQYEDEGRTRRWSDECRLVSEKYPHPKGSGRCASPASILQLLYENSTLHEQECRAGYCAADLVGLDYAAIGCGNFTPWGSFPCFSSVFDWRSGTLAPRAEWAGLLTAGLTFFETVADEAANSPFSPRQMLSELRNVSVGAADLSSRYVRARYEVCREIDSEVHPLADAIDAVRDGLSQVQSDSRSTPKVHGGQVNIFWFSYEAVGLLAKVYFEYWFALGSMGFIFVYMTFNIGSFTLACAGMLEILVSIPLALSIWKNACGQDNIDFLQLVMVFLILCIGADDVFVFVDTWQASANLPSAISGTLETRMSYTLRKAAGTMLTTTLTTCICLVLTAVSTIPTVRAFGMFGSFLVLVNYLQVITWFPACVIWHERHVCFAGEPLCFCCTQLAPMESGQLAKEARMARIMKIAVAPMIFKLRVPLLLLSTLLAAAGAYARMALYPPAVSIPLFRATHPFEIKQRLNNEAFFQASGDDDHVYCGMVYGLASFPVHYPSSTQIIPSQEEKDRQGQLITVKYDSAFRLDAAAQMAVVDNCDAARASGLIQDDGSLDGVYCILEELKKFQGHDFPFTTESALVAALDAFYASPAYARLQDTAQQEVSKGYDQLSGVAIDGTGDQRRVTALYNSFTTHLSKRATEGGIFGGDPRVVRPTFSSWTALASRECVDVGCFSALYSAGSAVRLMALLQSISSFANVTILQSVGACFVVLVLVTMNWIVALYTTLTVAYVIASVMGCIIACGLKDGMYENIFTILVVGMSIDYAVHLAHFYSHAAGTRYEKVQEALYGICPSVLGGAATTIGAGFGLLFTVVMFFYVQGLFILFTAICALFHSLAFLMPLLMIAGPVGHQGDLSWLSDRYWYWCGRIGAGERTRTVDVARRADSSSENDVGLPWNSPTVQSVGESARL